MLQQPLLSFDEIIQRQNNLKYFQEHESLVVKWHNLMNEAPLSQVYSHHHSQYSIHDFPNTVSGRFKAVIKTFKNPNYFRILTLRITAVIKSFSLFQNFLNEMPEEMQTESIVSVLNQCKNQWSNPLIQNLFNKISKGEEISALLIFQMDKHIRSNESEFFEFLWNTIYLWDAYFSVIKTIEIYNLKFPEIQEKGTAYIEVEGLKHLMVSECVQNSLTLDDKERILLLTGSNMAGKTTLGKALGSTIYLAHCGFPVPAESLKLSFLHNFYSSFYIQDDLHRGFSLFKSELVRLKEILKDWKSNNPFLLILDEPFSGTNYQDSRDCTRSLIESILETENFLLLILTHHIELANEYEKESSIKLQYLDVKQNSSNFDFSYRLKSGISARKIGWVLYKREGFENLLSANKNDIKNMRV